MASIIEWDSQDPGTIDITLLRSNEQKIKKPRRNDKHPIPCYRDGYQGPSQVFEAASDDNDQTLRSLGEWSKTKTPYLRRPVHDGSRQDVIQVFKGFEPQLSLHTSCTDIDEMLTGLSTVSVSSGIGTFRQESSSVEVSKPRQFESDDAYPDLHQFQSSQFQDGADAAVPHSRNQHEPELRQSDLMSERNFDGERLHHAMPVDFDSNWTAASRSPLLFSDPWSHCNPRTGGLTTVPCWETRDDPAGFQDAQKSTSNFTVHTTLGQLSSTSRSGIFQHDDGVRDEPATSGSVHLEPQTIVPGPSVPPSVGSGSYSGQSAPRTMKAFGESQADDAFTSTLPTSQGNSISKPEQPGDKPIEHDFRDSETVYSLESGPGEESYVTAFAHRLLRDLKNKKSLKDPSTLPSAFIAQTLRLFARRLYEESTDPFQWGTSVVLHRKRK